MNLNLAWEKSMYLKKVIRILDSFYVLKGEECWKRCSCLSFVGSNLILSSWVNI